MQNDAPKTVEIPQPVSGLHDVRMWETITDRKMALPYCTHCTLANYPPFESCAKCLRTALPWRTLSGRGTVLSWTRFHRSYLPAYPAPYTVIAVELEEGAVMVASLIGAEPVDDLWIGQAVTMTYVENHGKLLPVFEIC